MTSTEQLVERIQSHIVAAIVESARPLPPVVQRIEGVCSDDATIYPFVYTIKSLPSIYRGAFTNGDPIWEEADSEAFARAMGEDNSGVFYRLDDSGNAMIFEGSGSACTRITCDAAYACYPIGSTESALYEHPEGIVLEIEDAKHLSIPAEG